MHISRSWQSLATERPVVQAFLSFFPIWVGLAIVNKIVHKRPLQALYGSGHAINWRHFITGAIFLITILAFGEILSQIYFAATGAYSYSPNLIANMGVWLLWLLPMSANLFIQIGAEELFFVDIFFK